MFILSLMAILRKLGNKVSSSRSETEVFIPLLSQILLYVLTNVYSLQYTQIYTQKRANATKVGF